MAGRLVKDREYLTNEILTISEVVVDILLIIGISEAVSSGK
jgi:uncharacterized membrane protein YkgB